MLEAGCFPQIAPDLALRSRWRRQGGRAVLITNLPPNRHFDAIVAQMQAARRADLMVSYIQSSGVRALRREVVRLCGSEYGGVRLICSFDMGITDPEAVRELRNAGVEVRIFESRRGVFHPKVWLFEGRDKRQRCLVGSANFTAGALFDNTEAGVLLENGEAVQQARKFFDSLWGDRDCHPVTDRDLDAWAKKRIRREKVNRQIARAAGKRDDDESAAILEEFVSSWIDIGVDKTTERAGKVVGKQWRGWYVIPDQGEIDDALMGRLAAICRVIAAQPGGALVVSKKAEGEKALVEILKITTAKLKRESHKKTPRELFVRQEKNYLVKLGLANPVGKSAIALSRHGLEFAQDGADRRRVYTEAMEEYKYNGLGLLDFTRRLLARVGRLDFVEFSFFACHAWASDEVDTVASLVDSYRALPEERRRKFVERMDARFREKLEPTAKGVKMNYDKNVRHTMSALGWCEGLRYDPERREISSGDGA